MGTICGQLWGFLHQNKHLSCPGASFEPFFEVYQRTAFATAIGLQEKGYVATPGLIQWLCGNWRLIRSRNFIKMSSSFYDFFCSSWCPWRCLFDMEGVGRSQEYSETNSKNCIRIWPACFSRWYYLCFFQESYHYIQDQCFLCERFWLHVILGMIFSETSMYSTST